MLQSTNVQNLVSFKLKSMLKEFFSRPIAPLIVFLVLTLSIWIAGKFYSPMLSNAEPYIGGLLPLMESGKLVNAEGMVIDSGRNRQGIRFFTLQGQQGQFGVSFFPSLGKLPYVPSVGDFVGVIGLYGTYQGKPQVSPLSSQAIKLKSASARNPISDTQIHEASFPTVSIDQLRSYMDKTVWIEKLRCIFVEKFVSRKGQKILRFKLTDSLERTVEGVFFEGNWDESVYKLLVAGSEFRLLAKVGLYRGNLSLNGKQVKAYQA